MSGFEITGIILGSLPLLITALEHYGDGVRTIQKWRKYERELQSVIRNLKTERVKLQNVCEKLLDGLVPASRIDSMVEDPLGELWQEKETQKKIRVRLWRSYDVFEQTVQEMKAAIEETVDKLGVGTKQKKSDGFVVVRELKRAAFTLNRSAYTGLLSTIRDGISNLESLTTMNIDLEPKRRARSHMRFLTILRSLSSSMYRAVSSSLACACKHKVLMRLSTWPAEITPEQDDEDIIQNLKFRLALSSEPVRSPTVAEPHARQMEGLESWEEILLQANRLWQSQATTGPVAACSPVLSRVASACPPRPDKKKGKTVNFASFRSSLSTTATATATTTGVTTTGVVAQGCETTTVISNLMSKMTLEVTSVALSNFGTSLDLCGQLRKDPSQEKVECYGIVFDPDTAESVAFKARSYAVYPVPSVMLDPAQKYKLVSLRDVLEGKYGLPPLGYRHRLQLAVFIARSILQFYKTPWLPESPSCRNVFFILQGAGVSDNSTLPYCYYEHAFVMAGSGCSRDGEGSSILSLIRSPTLLALGILLVELVQNKTIDSLRSLEEQQVAGERLRQGNSQDKLLADYMTARRLLGEVYQTSSNYGSAVRRCINAEFACKSSGPRLDLEDEDLRQEVYSGVVALLEEDLGNV